VSLIERLGASLSAIVRETVLARMTFLGVYEYTIASCAGGKLDARATPGAAAAGLPAQITSVTMRPSILGEAATWPPGSSCLIAFVNGDPTRPYVLGGDPSSVPLTSTIDATAGVTIGNGDTRPIARLGDTVQAGPFSGVITSGSLLNKSG
jgi:hypothetical protein